MKRILLALVFSLWSQLALAGVACTLPFNLQNGTTADATQVMANYNALVTCLGNAAAAGANTDITALLGLTTPLTPTAGGSSIFGGTTSTGSANAQVVATTSPTGFALTQNYIVAFIAGFTNTGAMTLEVNSQTVASTTVPVCSSGTCPPPFYIQSPSGPIPMMGGEVQAGQLVLAQWDGTYFEMLSNGPQYGGFGAQTTLASATTTTLAGSHNVSVTGTTTITSFGASASIALPVYRVTFSGALTITYNQTSCSTTGGCINTPTGSSITTTAGDSADMVYIGAGSGGGGNWTVTRYLRANGTSLVNSVALGGVSGLTIANDATTPSSIMDVVITGSAVMLSATGVPTFTSAINVFPNITTNGANGLDTGTVADSTWYNVYLISTGSTVAGLYSLSATSPTLPSGYVYFLRLGAVLTDGSANLMRTWQKGNRTQYRLTASSNTTVAPNIANGTAGTYSNTSPVLAAASVSAVVPPTATRINLNVTNDYKASGSNASVMVAPNAAWGGTNNGPYGSNGNVYPFTGINTVGQLTQQVEMLLESSSVYWASTGAGGAISCMGWTDAVNAN
jgi:hypothetical protein